jgi:hypothetical protein
VPIEEASAAAGLAPKAGTAFAAHRFLVHDTEIRLMGQNSLLGVRRAATNAKGRDNAALGPSDSSDSGSDTVGIADAPCTDPFAPVDVVLGDDAQHPLQTRGVGEGADTDAAGSGERRSAGNDAEANAGSDISVDRVVADPTADPTLHDDEDPDLAFMDGAQDVDGAMSTAAAPDPLSDEQADDEEELVGAAAARRSAMHDRERDVRLGRLHGKRKKPRPVFED